jgi:hypothetical protein
MKMKLEDYQALFLQSHHGCEEWQMTIKLFWISWRCKELEDWQRSDSAISYRFEEWQMTIKLFWIP